MLHTLSRSPWQCDFACLLRTLAAGDDLLLLQDGVIVALADSEFLPALLVAPATVSILEDDVLARGLSRRLASQIPLIGWSQFVQLAVIQTKQMSW